MDNLSGGTTNLLRMARSEARAAAAFVALALDDDMFATATYRAVPDDELFRGEAVDDLIRQVWADPELGQGRTLVRVARLGGRRLAPAKRMALAILPLMDGPGGRPWGLLGVAGPEAGSFDAGQLELLGQIAHRLSSYFRARQAVRQQFPATGSGPRATAAPHPSTPHQEAPQPAAPSQAPPKPASGAGTGEIVVETEPAWSVSSAPAAPSAAPQPGVDGTTLVEQPAQPGAGGRPPEQPAPAPSPTEEIRWGIPAPVQPRQVPAQPEWGPGPEQPTPAPSPTEEIRWGIPAPVQPRQVPAHPEWGPGPDQPGWDRQPSPERAAGEPGWSAPSEPEDHARPVGTEPGGAELDVTDGMWDDELLESEIEWEPASPPPPAEEAVEPRPGTSAQGVGSGTAGPATPSSVPPAGARPGAGDADVLDQLLRGEDPLTGLLPLGALLGRTGRMLGAAAAGAGALAMVVLELVPGDRVDDDLLRAAGQALRRELRFDDPVARISRHHFAAVVPLIPGSSAGPGVEQHLVERVQGVLPSSEILVRSAHVVANLDERQDADELLRAALAALRPG